VISLSFRPLEHRQGSWGVSWLRKICCNHPVVALYGHGHDLGGRGGESWNGLDLTKLWCFQGERSGVGAVFSMRIEECGEVGKRMRELSPGTAREVSL
jgi:hypothetical protein